MAVRKFKPTTPGQRHKIIGTFEEITASVPEKSLVYGKKSSGGRNSEGKMTMRYIGGGHGRDGMRKDIPHQPDSAFLRADRRSDPHRRYSGGRSEAV